MDELKEALRALNNRQYPYSSLTSEQAGIVLDHIAAQDESIRVLKRNWKSATEELRVYLDQVGKQKDRIAELEAKLKSKSGRVKALEKMMLYIHTDEHGNVNYTDIDLRVRIAELEAGLKLSVEELNYLLQYTSMKEEGQYDTVDFLPGGCMWIEEKE